MFKFRSFMAFLIIGNAVLVGIISPLKTKANPAMLISTIATAYQLAPDSWSQKFGQDGEYTVKLRDWVAKQTNFLPSSQAYVDMRQIEEHAKEWNAKMTEIGMLADIDCGLNPFLANPQNLYLDSNCGDTAIAKLESYRKAHENDLNGGAKFNLDILISRYKNARSNKEKMEALLAIRNDVDRQIDVSKKLYTTPHEITTNKEAWGEAYSDNNPYTDSAADCVFTFFKTDKSQGKYCGETALKDFTNDVFTWGIAITVSIAILIVVYAGFQYIASGGNPDTISNAKAWLFSAFSSLALLMVAKVIFTSVGLKWFGD